MELNPFELVESQPLILAKDEWGYDSYNYNDLIESITDRIEWLVIAGFKDYQGEFFYLGKDVEGSLYYVVSGYGSCAGCDSLQSCKTLDEFLELRDELKRRIRKFDSLDEFEVWFNHEGQTEWYSDDDVQDFIEKANSHFPLSLKWR